MSSAIHPDTPLVVAEAVWQYSHHVLAGLLSSPRAHPHRRQLVRPVARLGRHAQPERLPHQGWRQFSTFWSRTSTTNSSSRPPPVASRRQDRSRPLPRARARRIRTARRPNAHSAPLSPRTARPIKPSSAYSTRAAWACTTPSSRRACSTPASSRSGSASLRWSPPCRTSPTRGPRSAHGSKSSGITSSPAPRRDRPHR